MALRTLLAAPAAPMAASLLILSGLALLKYVADGNVATAFALVSGACIFTALVLVVLVHLTFRATGLLAYAVAGAVVGGGPLAFLGWIFAFPGGSGFDDASKPTAAKKERLKERSGAAPSADWSVFSFG